MRSFLADRFANLHLGWHWPEALRAMRHRNFRLYFFGQLVSLIGSWMQTTAQQWLVYRLTGSQLSLGLVTFAGFIPVLLLSLFMGVVVDRVSRRRLLLLTQSWFLLLALALAVLTFLGIVQYRHIIVLALLFGIGNALDMPARQAFNLDMVEHDDLFNAIALNSSVFNGARIIGPAIGGLVIASWGEGTAFGLNAVSFLAVIAGLLMMSLPPFQRPAQRDTGLGDLKRGLAYLAGDRQVLGLVTMVAAFSLIGFPYAVLLPVFAQDVLRIGVEGYGILLGAQGVGALAAALSLAILGDRRPKGRLLWLSRWMLVAAVALLGFSRTTALSLLALALAGFALISQLAVTNTLIQLAVPDDLRGRVLSTYTWALGGFWPLGALL
ncbi:MAG: MFS transporter, partial [Anaerolineales bacterium]|nr:MFS transporter [Anaerolineales bacterium]